MKNIFASTKEYVQQPKRNVFDLSFQNNGTYNFGTLYPVFCKEVIPGDSFKIDTQFALRFLPMAFPIQTRMRANLHFFYVRNRNLWDDWKKFIGHTAETEPPYLDGTQDCIRTGGLADYLGVPTTIVGAYGDLQYLRAPGLMPLYPGSGTYKPYILNDGDDNVFINRQFLGKSLQSTLLVPQSYSNADHRAISTLASGYGFNFPFPESFTLVRSNAVYSNYNGMEWCILVSKGSVENATNIAYVKVENVEQIVDSEKSTFVINTPLKYWEFINLNEEKNFDSISELRSFLSELLDGEDYFITFTINELDVEQFNNPIGSLSYGNPSSSSLVDTFISFSFPVPSSAGVVDISSSPEKSVFSSINGIRLNALPFRAYESIYNAFYRNEQNDPLLINGKPEYDKYCPNTDSGIDDYPYKLYNRNWELDYLTSAVQSPQQGIAPLVGVSQSGDFTFVNKDSDGNIGYFTAKAKFSNDGNSITGFTLSDHVELSNIPLTAGSNVNVPDDVKRGTVYSLNQMALAGISINDFRNVNALQRWLETNIRRGYKYVDQIKSHFGVNVAYNVLDMPEFIGGVSEPVYINQVNQTTETETDPLGSYAGQASVMASSSHSVKHYCDEHGFIIGIFSVTPVPNYSQLLPKHFIKENYLDYFFPEFGHIGMQPIDYREVCPLQQFNVNPSGLLDTFGYQRAWYDYISSVDEIHGLFRTNLRNFVLNRQFDTLPRLNRDFLQVDAQQLNDVFTVQDVSDKILGQIHFNVIAKRPIPKFGIPRLE